MADMTVNLNDLPLLITRKDIPRYFGSLFSLGYLANLECAGKGPKKWRMGKKVVYKREDFIDWLNSRVQEA